MSNNNDFFKKLVAHSKEYGYIFQSSEVYDGLAAVYDYGPYGAELKNNIKQYWWKSMVHLNENIVGIDSAIFMHPKIWKASGHVDAFNDPLVDNKDSKKRYRADQLVEDHVEKITTKIEKEVSKAAKRFGDSFDREQFVATNPRVVANVEKKQKIMDRFTKAMGANDMADLKQLIIDCEIVDPVSGTKNWTDVRQFNLMFSTQMSNVVSNGEDSKLYLRPETAQGIFVNFLNVQKTTRQKLPFGIAQIGKAFRNEIVARQFIFRMREFEQMEMQFFVPPGEEMKWYEHWKAERLKWHKRVTPTEKLRFHDHENLAHYANAASDIEFKFPFGFKELEGIHSRTDFDLSSHQKLSGRKIQYFDNERNESYVPFVVETSIGLDRMFLSVLTNAFKEEEVPNAKGGTAIRSVLNIHPSLAPVKAAILPLVKKDGLPEASRAILNELKYELNCFYEDKDTIGKRYRRQDAVGTPFCITVDHQTLEDDTVTLRNRDTMEQERVNKASLLKKMKNETSIERLLKS